MSDCKTIGDPSETDMPYRRPIRDLHTSLETNMPHWRPTCLIGNPSETNMPHRRPTCLIGDQHASSETHTVGIKCLILKIKCIYFSNIKDVRFFIFFYVRKIKLPNCKNIYIFKRWTFEKLTHFLKT